MLQLMVKIFHSKQDLMGYFIEHISVNKYWLCLPDMPPKLGKLYSATVYDPFHEKPSKTDQCIYKKISMMKCSLHKLS